LSGEFVLQNTKKMDEQDKTERQPTPLLANINPNLNPEQKQQYN
jgi:hypothetical protein